MKLQPLSPSSTVHDLLMGAPVIDSTGAVLGKVHRILVDARTLMLHYVQAGNITFKWSDVYFDHVNSRLVFYKGEQK